VSPPEAYVFDLDGTLATIPVDWGRVKDELRAVTGSEEEFKSVFPTIVDVLAKRPGLQKKAFAIIDRHEVEAVPSARLYEGSLALLSKLSETARLSLVTMQGERACSMMLERFELKQYFVHYFTRDDSLDRAEQVRFALGSVRAKAATSMFVGDRLNDLNAAKKVGVPFTMIRTHGEDPEDEDVPVYHSVTEFLGSLGL
jgi:phosphoglycolate phosphatase-like HAD superfamily hydrolase